MNLRHETFICEMIAHGNRAKAYLAAYPSSSAGAAYNNACRLLSKPEVRNRIHAVVLTTENEVIARLKDSYETDLAKTIEKRVLLAKIIRASLDGQQEETGNALEEQKPNRKETNRYQKKHSAAIPTVSQVLRAIVLDTKLEYGWKRKL